MRCVILAAGTSTRLRPLTDETPKCLLPLGAQTILSKMLSALHAHDCNEIAIVTGFCEEKIRTNVQQNFPSATIHFIFNEHFATTNNASSLLLAEEFIGENEFLLLDSDIVFDNEVLSRVVHTSHHNCVAVRTVGVFGSEEIKVSINKQNQILRIGKEVASNEAFGESVGIEKFSRATTKKLFTTLKKRIMHEQRTTEFYEASFQEMIDDGEVLHAVDLGTLRCIEIDTIEDYEMAQRVFVLEK